MPGRQRGLRGDLPPSISSSAAMVGCAASRAERECMHNRTRFVLRCASGSHNSRRYGRPVAPPRTDGRRMVLLDGKKALISGVPYDHSIAWGIAQAPHLEGATVGFTSVESLIERCVRQFATSIGATFVEACDVM